MYHAIELSDKEPRKDCATKVSYVKHKFKAGKFVENLSQVPQRTACASHSFRPTILNDFDNIIFNIG